MAGSTPPPPTTPPTTPPRRPIERARPLGNPHNRAPDAAKAAPAPTPVAAPAPAPAAPAPAAPAPAAPAPAAPAPAPAAAPPAPAPVAPGVSVAANFDPLWKRFQRQYYRAPNDNTVTSGSAGMKKVYEDLLSDDDREELTLVDNYSSRHDPRADKSKPPVPYFHMCLAVKGFRDKEGKLENDPKNPDNHITIRYRNSVLTVNTALFGKDPTMTLKALQVMHRLLEKNGDPSLVFDLDEMMKDPKKKEVLKQAFETDPSLQTRLSRADRKAFGFDAYVPVTPTADLTLKPVTPATAPAARPATGPATGPGPAPPPPPPRPPGPSAAAPASPVLPQLPAISEDKAWTLPAPPPKFMGVAPPALSMTTNLSSRMSSGSTSENDLMLNATEMRLLNQKVLKDAGFVQVNTTSGNPPTKEATTLWEKRDDSNVVEFYAIDAPGTTHMRAQDPLSAESYTAESVLGTILNHLQKGRIDRTQGAPKILFIANVGGSGSPDGDRPTHYVAGCLDPRASKLTLSDSYPSSYLHGNWSNIGTCDSSKGLNQDVANMEKAFFPAGNQRTVSVIAKKDTCMQPDAFSCGLYAARGMLALGGIVPSQNSPVHGLVSAGQDALTNKVVARVSAVDALKKCGDFKDTGMTSYNIPAAAIAELWQASYTTQASPPSGPSM